MSISNASAFVGKTLVIAFKITDNPSWARIFDFNSTVNNNLFLTGNGANSYKMRTAIKKDYVGFEDVIINNPQDTLLNTQYIAAYYFTDTQTTFTVYKYNGSITTEFNSNGNPMTYNSGWLSSLSNLWLGRSVYYPDDPYFIGTYQKVAIYEGDLNSQLDVTTKLTNLLVNQKTNNVTEGSYYTFGNDTENVFKKVKVYVTNTPAGNSDEITLNGGYLSVYQIITPSAPSAPTLTSITPGNQQLSVYFTAGSEGGGPITNYQYSINNGSSFQTFSPAQTSSPVVITGLTNEQSYDIQLKAVNDFGVSDASNTLTATPTPPTAPSAPTIDSITAGNYQLTIYFTQGSDGNSPITNYQYSINNGSSFQAFSPAQTSSPVLITGLDKGTTYNIQLKAVNAIGASDASATIQITTTIAPDCSQLLNRSLIIGFTFGSIPTNLYSVNMARVFDFNNGTNNYLYFTPFADAQKKFRIGGRWNGGTEISYNHTISGYPKINENYIVSLYFTNTTVTYTFYANNVQLFNGTLTYADGGGVGNVNDLKALQNLWFGKSAFEADPYLSVSIQKLLVYNGQISDPSIYNSNFYNDNLFIGDTNAYNPTPYSGTNKYIFWAVNASFMPVTTTYYYYSKNFGNDKVNLTITYGVGDYLAIYSFSPVNNLSITGTNLIGNTLTADTSTITDLDGPSPITSFTYQWVTGWLYNNLQFTNITGETNSTYTLTTDQEAKYNRVYIEYVDGAGFRKSLASPATKNNGNPPYGNVVITGNIYVGGTVLPDVSGVYDPDGPNPIVPSSYQWQNSSDGSAYADIIGQTSSTLVISSDYLGQYIKVRITYYDSLGNLITLISDATPQITSPPPPGIEAYSWNSCAVSATGQYMTVIASPTVGLSGAIAVSSDYGQTWAIKKTFSQGIYANRTLIAISGNGKYIVATISTSASNDLTKPLLSSDYGETWREVGIISESQWQKPSVSADGQIILLCSANYNIQMSFDYGNSWNLIKTASDGGYGLGQIKCSSDGKILYGLTTTYSSKLYISTSYGNEWTLLLSDVGNNYTLNVSADGNTVICTSYTTMKVSTDRGKTWNIFTYDAVIYDSSPCLSADGTTFAYINNDQLYISKAPINIDAPVSNFTLGNNMSSMTLYSDGSELFGKQDTTNTVIRFAKEPVILPITGTEVSLSTLNAIYIGAVGDSNPVTTINLPSDSNMSNGQYISITNVTSDPITINGTGGAYILNSGGGGTSSSRSLPGGNFIKLVWNNWNWFPVA